MIESRRTLSAADLAAIADLEQRVTAADGGRLKLEWRTLRSRGGERTSDFLAVEDGRVVGFLGVYAFGDDPELAGMVDPAARRRGIGAQLLTAAMAECRDRSLASVLLVVPRPSVAGAALARTLRGTLDHSEHAMVLSGPPVDGPSYLAVTVRVATRDDAAEIARLLEAGFGWAPVDAGEKISGPGERTELVLLDGAPIGTLRLNEDGETGSVYGFVIDPTRQGRGIGGDVLRRACRELRERGASRVTLEVAVENERALGLYTRIGFEPVLTEDYHRLPL